MSACAICGGPRSDPRRMTLGGFEVVFCPACRVGETQLAGIEQRKEREAVAKRLYNKVVRLETYFGRRIEFNRRYEQTFSLLSPYGPFRSALDVGCNLGYWLHFLRKRGIQVTGLEMNDECRRLAQDVFELPVRRRLDELDRRFDLISLVDVLEHMEDPAGFLRESGEAAQEGAVYFIQLPNHESRMARSLGADWPWWAVPDHLWHFTTDGLRTLLERAGLDVLELRTCDTMYDTISYSLPGLLARFLRPLLYVPRTSGLSYRHGSRGSLIQAVAKRIPGK